MISSYQFLKAIPISQNIINYNSTQDFNVVILILHRSAKEFIVCFCIMMSIQLVIPIGSTFLSRIELRVKLKVNLLL